MVYTEEVTRWRPITQAESIEAPEALIKLVNGNDEKFGRNGYHYLGCHRKKQGGHTIDRLREYIEHHNNYCKPYNDQYGYQPNKCDCPIKL